MPPGARPTSPPATTPAPAPISSPASRSSSRSAAPTEHTVTLSYDFVNSTRHFGDYLTTYNRSLLGVDPTSGISGVSGVTPTSAAIPADGGLVAAGFTGTQAPGNFTAWNATITS